MPRPPLTTCPACLGEGGDIGTPDCARCNSRGALATISPQSVLWGHPGYIGDDTEPDLVGHHISPPGQPIGSTTLIFGDPAEPDMVNHPPHYKAHPSGVECITIVEHLTFCLGNAIKYIWRAGEKTDNPIEDLRKARWYLDREITRLESAHVTDPGTRQI